MRRTVLRTVIAFALFYTATPSLFAQHTEIVDIAKLDRSMSQYKAKKRHFRNKKEFKRHRRHHRKQILRRNNHSAQGIKAHSIQRRIDHGRRYHRDQIRYWNNERGYKSTVRSYQRVIYGKPHRYTKRGWMLAYRYNRAEFYDQDGFHYGYFNRYGYMFEGDFYHYDRYYTYRDRIRGRGLFDRFFYTPAQWQYYGSCR